MSKIKVRVNGKVLSFPEGTPEQEMQEAMEQFLLSEKSQPKKEEGGLYEKVVSKLNPLIEEKPLGLIARKLKGSALIPETTKELKREVVEQIPAAAGTASLMIPGAGAFIAPAAAGSGEYVKEKLLEEDVSPFLIAMQTGLNSFPLLGKTPLKNVAEGLAEKFALKVIKPTAKELKGLFHKGQSEKSIARTLLDNKILSGNTGKMLEKTQSALDETGQGIEGILKSVDDINLTKKTNISEPVLLLLI